MNFRVLAFDLIKQSHGYTCYHEGRFKFLICRTLKFKLSWHSSCVLSGKDKQPFIEVRQLKNGVIFNSFLLSTIIQLQYTDTQSATLETSTKTREGIATCMFLTRERFFITCTCKNRVSAIVRLSTVLMKNRPTNDSPSRILQQFHNAVFVAYQLICKDISSLLIEEKALPYHIKIIIKPGNPPGWKLCWVSRRNLSMTKCETQFCRFLTRKQFAQTFLPILPCFIT